MRSVMSEEKGMTERPRRRQLAKQEGEGLLARCHGLEQATKHHSPVDWSIRGAAEKGRQAQGARAGKSREE